jgi:hypothetical protein
VVGLSGEFCAAEREGGRRASLSSGVDIAVDVVDLSAVRVPGHLGAAVDRVGTAANDVPVISDVVGEEIPIAPAVLPAAWPPTVALAGASTETAKAVLPSVAWA